MRYYERIVTKQQLISFEADMLKHLKNHCFQSFDSFIDPHSSCYYLKYARKASSVTLNSRMNEGIWSKAQVVELIESLILLHQYCLDYLLDIKKIDFSPATIDYDFEAHEYQWRYWPLHDYESHMSLSQLIREVLWHTSELRHLMASTEQNMTLSHLKSLLEAINSKPETAYSKHKPFSFFKKKKPFDEGYRNPVKENKTSYQKTHSILVNRSAPEQSYPFQYEYTEIGRDEKCAIKLIDASISRFHAVIHRIEDAFYITDTASTNGTYINGVRIDHKTLLVNGDILQLGDKEFIFIR